ncbi:hypothetical protein Ancab_038145 [Ancistrocladus abbreviatus]
MVVVCNGCKLGLGFGSGVTKVGCSFDPITLLIDFDFAAAIFCFSFLVDDGEVVCDGILLMIYGSVTCRESWDTMGSCSFWGWNWFWISAYSDCSHLFDKRAANSAPSEAPETPASQCFIIKMCLSPSHA